MIELIKNEAIKKPTLLIEKALHEKIIYLCSRISSVEWSGVLFYEMEGTLGEDLRIIAKDLLLLNIHASTYTEYENDTTDIPAYMVEHGLTHAYQGHIHSHNTMATFFSGTDTATLKEEGAKRPHFLSLIVNNANQYTACITAKAEVEENLIFKGFSGNVLNIQIPEDSATRISVHYVSTEIICENDEPLVELDEQIKKLSIPVVTTTVGRSTDYGNIYGTGYGTGYAPRYSFDHNYTGQQALFSEEDYDTPFPDTGRFINAFQKDNTKLIDDTELISEAARAIFLMIVTCDEDAINKPTAELKKHMLVQSFSDNIASLSNTELGSYLDVVEDLLADNIEQCVIDSTAITPLEKTIIEHKVALKIKEQFLNLGITSNRGKSTLLKLFELLDMYIDESLI